MGGVHLERPSERISKEKQPSVTIKEWFLKSKRLGFQGLSVISQGAGKTKQGGNKVANTGEVAKKGSGESIHAEGKRMRVREGIGDFILSLSQALSKCFIVLTHFAFTTTLGSRYYYLSHSLVSKTRHREVK